MKLFTREQNFEHPWERVAAAHWLKYPNQEHTPHIEQVDYISRYLDPSTGALHSTRLITCRQPVPRWLTAMLGISSGFGFAKEVSIVDPHRRTLTLHSSPYSMCDLAEFTEVCEYSSDPLTGHTKLKQHVSISLHFSGFMQRLASQVEDWCISRFEQNAEKGRAALDDVLGRLAQESSLK